MRLMVECVYFIYRCDCPGCEKPELRPGGWPRRRARLGTLRRCGAGVRRCQGDAALRRHSGGDWSRGGRIPTYPCTEQNVRVAGQRRAVRKYKCSPSHNRIVPHPRNTPLLLLSSAGNVLEAFLRWVLVIAGGGDVSKINTCYLGTPVSL
ncbi:uncharacterized protein SCHCODRAFT_02020495 [Schizophyllum commune H4-8]|uniref:uncharacterized protein n=1 Tax=Schizophyllum commune (strain H4-8 / FGSC 9210) TaxID=578458 RepID=UPI0021607362|nr:uncharacterized protein SCHCODRAFT_02020495 [Schizophyllum commune H4-8]KAI5899783.1 hypothetical protein SCHCODRAFT_02020495 [Schizophyllum commune H4-8]